MSKKKILIADDEKDILKMLSSRLKANDYEVEIAKDGDEAYAKAKSCNPDLIVLDVGMPGKNGLQVCRELKKDDAVKHVPILILSSWVKEEQAEEGGVADAYVRKPFKSEDFLEKVANLLNPQAEEEGI